MAKSVAELPAWAAEIARDKDVYPSIRARRYQEAYRWRSYARSAVRLCS
jgi:hypothetical protein